MVDELINKISDVLGVGVIVVDVMFNVSVSKNVDGELEIVSLG